RGRSRSSAGACGAAFAVAAGVVPAAEAASSRRTFRAILVTRRVRARLGIALLAARLLQRFRLDGGIHLETGNRLARQFTAKQLLDVAQQLVLVHADQRHGLAFVAGAPGAADAVDIILRHVRQL